MPEQINGLPAHVLLVHAVIALIPLAALALIGARCGRRCAAGSAC